jgi:deoxyribonuclease V
MLIPAPMHRWDLPVRTAISVQRRLGRQVRIVPLPRTVRWVAGLDAGFTRDGESCIAGVVLWDLEDGCVVEERWARVRLRFPYIPGLLSFREAPGLLAALRKLRHDPDVLLCDGQGLAHPRRLGIASHLGLWLQRPTVGCAKSLLTGRHSELDAARGSRADLLDREEVVGRAVRTRDRVKPVYVSVGHCADLDSACELVLACARGYRLPEPTRLADRFVARIKLRLKE